MNSLLNRVERVVSNSNFVMSIADSILNLIAPKATAMAGEYCGCDPECRRKEYVVYGGIWFCIVVGQPGSCQPC